MTEEPWTKHTPGDPMPCEFEDSVVEVRFPDGSISVNFAGLFAWGELPNSPYSEIVCWRFIRRRGADMIHRCAEREGGQSDCNWIASVPGDPYSALEWGKEETATVVLRKPGQPEWVRDDDIVRFSKYHNFKRAIDCYVAWHDGFAFQIKRRPVLTPAEPQLLAVLSFATDDEADAILSAARRANIEVPGTRKDAL